MARPENLIHITERTTFWSGERIALCGYRDKKSNTRTVIFGFADDCPTCRAKARKRKGAKR